MTSLPDAANKKSAAEKAAPDATQKEKKNSPRQAKWWRPDSEGLGVECTLCPHACHIPEGKSGRCGARSAKNGELVSAYLGRFSSIAVDPIEKKPLYHWRPGSSILSLGSVGCTMRCRFCQNHSIAQPDWRLAKRLPLQDIPIPKLISRTRKLGLGAIAFTYNEPALQAEYILAAAPLLEEAAIDIVLVTNGMYSEDALKELAPRVAAVNIDLKSFNPESYTKLGGSLEAVKRSIAFFLNAGTHVEVTTLVVPGINDKPEEFAELTEWLASLSPGIPFHISRYRPAFKHKEPPTDIGLLLRFAALAEVRLKNVHVGNVPQLRL